MVAAGASGDSSYFTFQIGLVMVSIPNEMGAFSALRICWPYSIDVDAWIAWRTVQAYPFALKPAPLWTLTRQAFVRDRWRFAKDDGTHDFSCLSIQTACQDRKKRTAEHDEIPPQSQRRSCACSGQLALPAPACLAPAGVARSRGRGSARNGNARYPSRKAL